MRVRAVLAAFLAVAATQAVGQIRVDAGGGLPVFSVNTSRNLLTVLKRVEVQNAISLDLKQKQALEDLLSNPQRQGVRLTLDAQADRDPEALKKQIEDQIKAQQGDIDVRIKLVLKPDQYDRLQQLDLQWRGPLALADQKVAGRLKIEQPHRVEINKIAGEYQMVKGQVMMELAEKSQQDDGNGQRRVIMRMNTKELENPLSPAYKKLDAAKKDAEKKILAVLSPDEKSVWKAAQGEPFTFRTDQRGNRF